MPLTLPGDAAPDLPETGPGTVEAVKVHLKITDDTDDARLAAIVAATNEVVRGLPVAADAEGEPLWGDRISYGATLLAARLFKRKNSPAGVEGFGEFGPLYVARNDPDITMLLRLGRHAPPGVG